MRKLSVSFKVYLLVGLSVLAGCTIIGVLLFRLDAVVGEYERLVQTQKNQARQQDLARTLQVSFKKEIQAGKDTLLRGHNFEDFQKYSKEFKDNGAIVNEHSAALVKALTDSDVREIATQFVEAHRKLVALWDTAIKEFGDRKGADAPAADKIVRGQDRAPTDLMDAIVVELQKRVDGLASSTAASAASTRWFAILFSVVGFACVAVFSALFTRAMANALTGMVSQMRESAEQVVSAAEQVSTSAQSLSQGATEQAASLEETSASMEEMASMTRKNAENSQQAAHLMGEVDRLVDGSNKALEDMTQSMASIGDSSNKVSKIIKTIDEIAFQTNILALNAAVEAARAGEAGMGFAVVADEVRNLAQRSAQAAKDTASLIEESIAKSQEGNAKVAVVVQSIAAITESVGKVKGLVTEVSEASRQQTQGIDQVSQAISQMEKVTQTTAATAEESAAASEELNAQAETSMAAVGQLEALVGGSRANAAAASAARRANWEATAKTPKLLKHAPKASVKQPLAPTAAESEIPMRDSGTYGRF